jgi:hypothetical protein
VVAVSLGNSKIESALAAEKSRLAKLVRK